MYPRLLSKYGGIVVFVWAVLVVWHGRSCCAWLNPADQHGRPAQQLPQLQLALGERQPAQIVAVEPQEID